MDFVFTKLNQQLRCTQMCVLGLRWKKNGFGSMLMWGEMPTTKTHLPSITWAPGRVLPLRGALRRGFARDLRIWIQSTGHLWEGPLGCTSFCGVVGLEYVQRCGWCVVVFVNQFRFDLWCTWEFYSHSIWNPLPSTWKGSFHSGVIQKRPESRLGKAPSSNGKQTIWRCISYWSLGSSS